MGGRRAIGDALDLRARGDAASRRSRFRRGGIGAEAFRREVRAGAVAQQSLPAGAVVRAGTL